MGDFLNPTNVYIVDKNKNYIKLSTITTCTTSLETSGDGWMVSGSLEVRFHEPPEYHEYDPVKNVSDDEFIHVLFGGDENEV